MPIPEGPDYLMLHEQGRVSARGEGTAVRCLSMSGQDDTFNGTVGLEVQRPNQRPPDLGSGGQD